MPSPRPSAPRLSFVVALTDTHSCPTRNASAMLREISDARGPTTGASATTVTSTFTSRPPAPSSIARIKPSRWRLEASFQRGSPEGKCRPRSPSAAAPSTASPTAWLSTSASLWPASPQSASNTTPPRTSRRPAVLAWMSYPIPTRSGMSDPRRSTGEPRLGQLQVARRRDLEVDGIARRQMHTVSQCFHQHRVVGGVMILGLVRQLDPVAAEDLRSLRAPERRSLERIRQRDGGNRRAVLERVRDDAADQVRARQRPGAVVNRHGGGRGRQRA